MHTIKGMDAASGELTDLDSLSVAELKAMLREQHAALQEKHAQLAVQDTLLRSYTVEIEALKLQILKLRRMQFGNRSEKRAQEIEQLELWVAQLEGSRHAALFGAGRTSRRNTCCENSQGTSRVPCASPA
jgi:hypothetical protein